MIQTTHVGSLPFLTLEKALDYTFRFDVPVLFTLPKLYEHQFIHKEIFEISKHKRPYFYEEFKQKAKEKGVKKIKYQLLGPVSFFALNLNQKMEIDNFLNLHKMCVDLLQKDFELLYVLDEPLLDRVNDESFAVLKSLSESLIQKDSLELAIHCCAKLPSEMLGKFNFCPLNLDIALYDHFSLDKEMFIFPGINLNKKHLDQEFKNNNILRYISPSCGLALNNVKELDTLFNRLDEIKKSCINSSFLRF